MTGYDLFQETMLLWYVRDFFIRNELWTDRDDRTLVSVKPEDCGA